MAFEGQECLFCGKNGSKTQKPTYILSLGEVLAKTSPSLTDPNWRAIEKVFSIYQKKDPKILDFAPFVRARLNKKALNEVVASVQDAKKDQPKRKM